MKILNAGSSKMVSVDAIQCHPQNPRKGDLNVVRQSIRENGFYGYCLVQQSTGYILVGNHRYLAAKEEGAAKVPVTYVDVSDSKGLEIMLADNHTSDLGGYDEVKLAQLLEEIKLAGNLDATTYSDKELEELLERLANDATSGDKQAQVGDAEEDAAQEGICGIIIKCRDEADQRKLLEELHGRGVECRALL